MLGELNVSYILKDVAQGFVAQSIQYLSRICRCDASIIIMADQTILVIFSLENYFLLNILFSLQLSNKYSLDVLIGLGFVALRSTNGNYVKLEKLT